MVELCAVVNLIMASSKGYTVAELYVVVNNGQFQRLQWLKYVLLLIMASSKGYSG